VVHRVEYEAEQIAQVGILRDSADLPDRGINGLQVLVVRQEKKQLKVLSQLFSVPDKQKTEQVENGGSNFLSSLLVEPDEVGDDLADDRRDRGRVHRLNERLPYLC
jgi:hypothetical protein